MKKSYLVLIPLIFNLIYSQSVVIKDGETIPNTLIEINDEGAAGSITIPDATTVSQTTDKLYNEGGALKWSGNTLATGSSLWALNSGNVYRSTGNVGIGTTNPISKLSVGGYGSSGSTIYGEIVNGNGVYGYATGSSGVGVYGYADDDADVKNYGGIFVARGSTGRGVTGSALHSSGINYGVYGICSSNAGYAGYFQGRGYFSGDVGIGTETPDEKLEVNGNIKTSGNVTIGDFLNLEVTAQTISSGGTINPSSSYIKITNAVHVDNLLNITTSISDGTTVGQILILEGNSSPAVCKIQDNSNVQLTLSVVSLEINGYLTLMWNGTDWIQISYSST